LLSIDDPLSCLKIGLLREELRCCVDNEYYFLVNQGNEQNELGLLVAKIQRLSNLIHSRAMELIFNMNAA